MEGFASLFVGMRDGKVGAEESMNLVDEVGERTRPSVFARGGDCG